MKQKIRIVYPSAFDIKGVERSETPRESLMEAKDPDTEIVVRRAPDAFVEFVEQTYEAELVAVVSAREAWKIEQEGDVDAICMGCNAEPGVKAGRELCDTLVMGPACAVLHVASMLGRSFSYVICGGEGEVRHAREALLTAAEHYGLAHKLASIRELELPPTGFNEALLTEEELESLKEYAVSEAKKAIYEDGADVIIDYGHLALHRHMVEQLAPLGVPVVNPDQTTVKVMEMLVKLGLSQSKRTYPKPRQVYDFEIRDVQVVEDWE